MRNYFKVAIVQRKKPTLFSRIQTALLSFTSGTMLVVFVAITVFIVINYEQNIFLLNGCIHFSRTLMFFILILLFIFVIVMFLSSVLSYIISKRLAAPLSIIEQHMSEIEVGGENAKINYPQIEGDALSRLVIQYNEMIDNLAISAEKIAQTEREESWRQMARQMAHEIKNPLTPMQLLTQRLLLLHTEDIEEYKQTVQSLSKSLLQGIENITITTDALSNFAKQPMLPLETINIVERVRYIVDLFKNNEKNVSLSFYTTTDEANILVDREMIGNVFNNLLKNAIQSIPDSKEGKVSVEISHNESEVTINVTDNGCGISEENKDKLFNVNFTTKVHGMGLGLIVVKKVIDQAKGSINFYSDEGEGTTFVVKFPLKK